MKSTKEIIVIFLLFSFLLVSGCSQTTAAVSSTSPVGCPRSSSSSGRLLAGFTEDMESPAQVTSGPQDEGTGLPEEEVPEKPNDIKEPDKVVFLTFDDGPSEITPGFLDILKENGVQATFCVIGVRAQMYPDTIKRAYDEGNSIICHSYNHIMGDVYKGCNAFMDSMDRCNKSLDSIIERSEVEKKFIRLPGGSRISFVMDHRDNLLPLLTEMDYHTLDWNVSSGDCATGFATVEYITANASDDMNSDAAVILMHDFKYRTTTMQSLPAIIKHYKEKGYAFKTIRDITPGEIERLKSKKIIDMMY